MSQNEGDRLEKMDESEIEGVVRGVENPDIIDLIHLDRESGEVALVIVENRPWSGERKQLEEFDEKLNRYMTYILNGFVGKHYPDFAGRPVRIVIDAKEPPHGNDLLRFLAGVEQVCEANDIGFAIRAGAGS